MISSHDDKKLAPNANDVIRLLEARHHDPFSVLGRHDYGNEGAIRIFSPSCRAVFLESEEQPMQRIGDSDLFEFIGDLSSIPQRYQLIIEADSGERHRRFDPYSFGTVISAAELQSFNQGKHSQAYLILGANSCLVDGIDGTLFSVWAPHAERVSVVGDFNHWDGRCHPMRVRGESGVWELFIPELNSGPYKFEIRQRGTDKILLKTDPYARFSEVRPATASLITQTSDYEWRDSDWLAQRSNRNWRSDALSIFEVHLGSWRLAPDGTFIGYRELATQLAGYVKHLGFTHVELLPITEHPLDESWGYQTTGYFSPTSRFGSPDDFRWFVDHLHQQGIGVILDWVPAHFPRDAHALAEFDGLPLYEYPDPRKGEHKDWGTLIFNYERNEVRSFLISSALYWMREFHLDGLRVDAVASMLYLDFSKQGQNWVPNRFGGNQNIEAIDFLRELNNVVISECPGCLMIAEESTDWKGVTDDTNVGGLGFHLKWNMGWMHDTLGYLQKDPVHRKHHQNWLTFGPSYAFNENFLLPLSHDEVVHLKRSLFGKMPGDEWQQYANLRLLFTYQWAYPGKQLLFMGGEFAQTTEWHSGGALQWERAEQDAPKGITALVRDLNKLQQTFPALVQWDCDSRGFEWISGDDRDMSIVTFMRHTYGQTIIVIMNFTPVVHQHYRVGVTQPGSYQEIFNSDDAAYGGSNVKNMGKIESSNIAWQNRPQSIVVTIPPLSGIMLIKE